MSVIVKGMTFPKCCAECDFESHDEYECIHECPLIYKGYTNKTRMFARLDECPLIELPSHGRLIDADKLVTIFKGISEAEAQIHGHGWNFTMRCINEIENASTVLEEEEE